MAIRQLGPLAIDPLLRPEHPNQSAMGSRQRGKGKHRVNFLYLLDQGATPAKTIGLLAPGNPANGLRSRLDLQYRSGWVRRSDAVEFHTHVLSFSFFSPVIL